MLAGDACSSLLSWRGPPAAFLAPRTQSPPLQAADGELASNTACSLMYALNPIKHQPSAPSIPHSHPTQDSNCLHSERTFHEHFMGHDLMDVFSLISEADFQNRNQWCEARALCHRQREASASVTSNERSLWTALKLRVSPLGLPCRMETVSPSAAQPSQTAWTTARRGTMGSSIWWEAMARSHAGQLRACSRA